PASLASDEFLIPTSELKSCGLPKASIVKLGKIVTLHQQLVIKSIGALPTGSLAAALGKFRQLC
ncbi:MAG: hypothetical protein DME22_00090, partial [Verrucomicrobia bacterium]